ncbi:MAG: HlyC/CorC family transporter [Kineosporiaceae bacterium]|nr:HlyC/CorC family transporter [Kineosporiaceae bacterium]
MSASGALLLALVLLLLNAFFVGAEFAVISARRSQVEPLAEAGRRGARTALWAMENVSLMLAAAQLGITICSLGLGAVAEPAVAHLLVGPFHAVGLPDGLVHPVAFTVALAVVVYLHVVVGEMIPKNLALAAPERAALTLAPALVISARAVSWLIRALRAVTNLLLRALHVEPKEELTSAFTAEEVHAIVTESRKEGLLEPGHDLLGGALTLAQRRAVDVMVPRERMVTLDATDTPQDVERLVAQTGFSRFPVLGTGGPSGPAELVGYLHLKDLLDIDDEQYAERLPGERVRPLASVASGDDMDDVLSALQRSSAHLARVDQEGATVGVVFLEDVLEELVGEVRDATQRSGTLWQSARAAHGV